MRVSLARLLKLHRKSKYLKIFGISVNLKVGVSAYILNNKMDTNALGESVYTCNGYI